MPRILTYRHSALLSSIIIVGVIAAYMLVMKYSSDTNYVFMYGDSACWVAISIVPLLLCRGADKIAALAFLLWRLGALADDLWLEGWAWGWNDTTTMAVMSLGGWWAYRRMRPLPTANYAVHTNILMLALLLMLSIPTRNAVFAQWLTGGDANLLFYKGTALGWVLMALFTLMNMRGIEKPIAVIFVAMAMNNFMDDMLYDPYTWHMHERVITVYVCLWALYSIVNRKLARSRPVLVKTIKIASVLLHTGAVLTLLAAFVYLKIIPLYFVVVIALVCVMLFVHFLRAATIRK